MSAASGSMRRPLASEWRKLVALRVTGLGAAVIVVATSYIAHRESVAARTGASRAGTV